MPFFLSPNVQVDRVNTFNSNIVLISFTERTIAPRNLSDQGFGQDFARKQAIDGFYVKCAGNHWYQYPEMLDALSAIRRAASGKDIVTYGSSMGAYAAMKFASALGAKRAVAISPIFSPDPRKPPFEGRWKTDADQIEFIDDTMIGAADTDAFVLTDPTHADARHGRLFRATFPRCTIVAVPFASHPVGHFLREAGLLGDLVKDLIFGAFDNSRWCRDRRKMRTKSPIYKSRLAEVLGERNPPLNHECSLKKMKRLDACPFCGIQDQLDLVRDDSRNGWIHCFSCGANGPTLRTLADDTVADAWNGRASQPLEKRPLTN